MSTGNGSLPAALIMGDNGFTAFINGKNYTVSKDNPKYPQLLDAIKAKDWDGVVQLLDLPKQVGDWLNGDPGFTLRGGLVELDGEAFGEPVSEKVLRMVREGFDATPLLKFLRKVRANPSWSAQQELLLFCVANGFAITDDGDIIAYKNVRADFRDRHSGTFDNSVGKVVQMPRHQVDDRRGVTCSRGLHFAAFEYANNFGSDGHLLAVKVNPTDVVSIPEDYQNQKGRCARYEVLAVVPRNNTPLPQKEVYAPADVTGRESWGFTDTCSDCGEDESNCTCY